MEDIHWVSEDEGEEYKTAKCEDGTNVSFLCSAVHDFNIHKVRLSLMIKCDPDMIGSNFRRTPLHVASEIGFTEAGRLLLKYGANVNIKDSLGMTPLDVAIKLENEDLGKLLIDYGANIKDSECVRSDCYRVLSKYQENLEAKRKDELEKRNMKLQDKYSLLTFAEIKWLLQLKVKKHEDCRSEILKLKNKLETQSLKKSEWNDPIRTIDKTIDESKEKSKKTLSEIDKKIEDMRNALIGLEAERDAEIKRSQKEKENLSDKRRIHINEYLNDLDKLKDQQLKNKKMFSDLTDEIEHIESYVKRCLVIEVIEKDQELPVDFTGINLLKHIEDLESKLRCSVCEEISEAQFYICNGRGNGEYDFCGDGDDKDEKVVCGVCWSKTNDFIEESDHLSPICPRCIGYAEPEFYGGRERLLEEWKQSVKKYKQHDLYEELDFLSSLP